MLSSYFFQEKNPGNQGFPGVSDDRVCPQCERPEFDPWVGKIPWRRKWQPTAVFLPGESHGQRRLVGYGPWGCRELKVTEQLDTYPHPKQYHFNM